MLNLKLVTLLLISMFLTPQFVQAKMAENHAQGAVVESSGGVFVKTQRQEKAANSTQNVEVKKSGGVIVIIQRNLNCKLKDIKEVVEANKNKK